MTDTRSEIQNLISSNDILIYMRGTPAAPRCGFSATVVEIMKRLNVPYHAVNADERQDHWAELAEMNEWPTMPQIYIKGEFMGGCDILKEMFLSGELQQVLADKGIAAA